MLFKYSPLRVDDFDFDEFLYKEFDNLSKLVLQAFNLVEENPHHNELDPSAQAAIIVATAIYADVDNISIYEPLPYKRGFLPDIERLAPRLVVVSALIKLQDEGGAKLFFDENNQLMAEKT